MNFYGLQYQNGDVCSYQSYAPLTKNIQWDSNYYPVLHIDQEYLDTKGREEKKEKRREYNKRYNKRYKKDYKKKLTKVN